VDTLHLLNRNRFMSASNRVFFLPAMKVGHTDGLAMLRY